MRYLPYRRMSGIPAERFDALVANRQGGHAICVI